MNALIVTSANNLDDVLLGVYLDDKHGLGLATAHAQRAASDPDARCVPHMPHDSGFVRTIVYRCTDSVKFAEVASFDETGVHKGKRRLDHPCACELKKKPKRPRKKKGIHPEDAK